MTRGSASPALWGFQRMRAGGPVALQPKQQQGPPGAVAAPPTAGTAGLGQVKPAGPRPPVPPPCHREGNRRLLPGQRVLSTAMCQARAVALGTEVASRSQLRRRQRGPCHPAPLEKRGPQAPALSAQPSPVALPAVHAPPPRVHGPSTPWTQASVAAGPGLSSERNRDMSEWEKRHVASEPHDSPREGGGVSSPRCT